MFALLLIVGIVSVRTKKVHIGKGGKGWWDLPVSEFVRMRFYADSAYWEAHGDIPDQNVLEKGTYKHDKMNWIRYSTVTSARYEEYLTEKWKRCGCEDCTKALEATLHD